MSRSFSTVSLVLVLRIEDQNSLGTLTFVAFFQTASRCRGVECRDGGQGIARWQNTTGASPDGGEEGHGDVGNRQIGRLEDERL